MDFILRRFYPASHLSVSQLPTMKNVLPGNGALLLRQLSASKFI